MKRTPEHDAVVKTLKTLVKELRESLDVETQCQHPRGPRWLRDESHGSAEALWVAINNLTHNWIHRRDHDRTDD